MGAAASIVLTFSPGLVAANAAPAVVLRPPANLRPQTVPDDDDDTAESEFRTVIRAARHALSEARDAANKAFRVAVAPHRRALDAAVVAAESNSERRAARVQYGQAILPAKIERKTAMQAAKVGYIDAVEQARIDFLAARGAAHDVLASAKYRHAVNTSTAEYRADVMRALGAFKIESASLRSAHGDSTGGATDRYTTQTRERAASEITGVFRSQVSSARATYQSKVTLARRILTASPTGLPVGL